MSFHVAAILIGVVLFFAATAFGAIIGHFVGPYDGATPPGAKVGAKNGAAFGLLALVAAITVALIGYIVNYEPPKKMPAEKSEFRSDAPAAIMRIERSPCWRDGRMA